MDQPVNTLMAHVAQRQELIAEVKARTDEIERLQEEIAKIDAWLLPEMQQHGLNSVKLQDGTTLRRKVRAEGAIIPEHLKPAFNYLHENGLTDKLKFKAEYICGVENLTELDQLLTQHESARKAGLTIHHATMDKLLREHPDLHKHCYVQIKEKLV